MIGVLRNFTLSAAVVLVTTSAAVSLQPFSEGTTYRSVDDDGLASTITVTRGQAGTQNLAEDTNIDIGKPWGCKLLINVKDNVTVPAGYNQKDFLERAFASCTWTTNQCGVQIPECTADNVTLLAGRYYMPSRSQLCAVWKTGSGNGVTKPRCFTGPFPLDKEVVVNGIKIFPAGRKK